MTRTKVVIVGAGFGGLWTARGLARRDVEVTLLDRNNYHTFFPLLYQVAAAELAPTDIAYPVRALFRKAANVSVRLAEMTGLDLERGLVRTDRGDLAYDRLVLALGSEVSWFGVEGAEQHAFPLRWMSDAIPLRHHILTRFEAAVTADSDERRRLLTFAIVGAGPTGVEYAGALAELVFGPLLRDFPGVRAEEVRILLLEGTDRVLVGMPPRLGAFARDRLARRGVEIRLSAYVRAVEPRALVLEGGERIPTETVVWTAGIQGEPRAGAWGLPVGRGGRVPVSPRLTLDEHPDVSVIGDLAYLEDDEGRPLPQVAQVAIQQGRYVAKRLRSEVEGGSVGAFRYRDPGMLAVIGRNAAVAHVFGRAFKGFTAWALWLGIHITWLIGYRNRALVLLNWGWNYVFYRRTIRLILPTVSVAEETRERSEDRT